MAPAPARGPQAGVPAGAGWPGEDCGRWRHICKVQQPEEQQQQQRHEALSSAQLWEHQLEPDGEELDEAQTGV